MLHDIIYLSYLVISESIVLERQSKARYYFKRYRSHLVPIFHSELGLAEHDGSSDNSCQVQEDLMFRILIENQSSVASNEGIAKGGNPA